MYGDPMPNVTVKVHNNDVATALRKLRKKCEQEGVMSDMRRGEFYRNPCEARRVKQARKRVRKVAGLLA
jgi:ribosomal protein S21